MLLFGASPCYFIDSSLKHTPVMLKYAGMAPDTALLLSLLGTVSAQL